MTLGGRGTHHDLQVAMHGQCWNRDVIRRRCSSGRFRFQLLDLVKLHNKSCLFVIFTGRATVMKGAGDSDDFFNVPNICFAVVDGVADLSDGGDDGLVGVGVICKGDCRMHSAKWLNRGTSTWNLWYGGCNVFLVGVIVLIIRGVIWVREGDSGDVGGSIVGDMEDARGLVLYCNATARHSGTTCTTGFRTGKSKPSLRT